LAADHLLQDERKCSRYSSGLLQDARSDMHKWPCYWNRLEKYAAYRFHFFQVGKVGASSKAVITNLKFKEISKAIY
jgi:hypothetical protein